MQKEAQENPENYPAKRLSPRHWSAIWYWDEPIFSGGSKGTARAGLVIAPDGRGIPFKHNWGSAHSNGAFFAIADGSTRFGGQNIDWKVIRALLTPDGREIESNDGLYMLGIDFCHC